jgi:hypothetical protein
VLGRMDNKGEHYDHELSYWGIKKRDDVNNFCKEYAALSV